MQDTNAVQFERNFDNDYATVEEFYRGALQDYDFSDFEVVRPRWDKYFMELAHLVS